MDPRLNPNQPTKKSRIAYWIVIAIIIAIGLAGAVYFVFIKTAGQGNVNVVQNTNKVSNINGNVNKATNVNTAANVNNVVNTNVDINDWQNYFIDWQKKIFYKSLADGTQENISLPFNFDDYHNNLTPYGAIFWRQGPDKTATIENMGPFTYEGAVNPDFQWYDFTKKEFITLPKKELQTGEQKFERIYAVHFSSSEPKLLIEIGQYDTQSSEFEPGMVDSQPVKTYGLIYDINTNKFESGDPLTVYRTVLELPTTAWYGLSWDSKNQIGVATPGGEGCGNYDTLIFVDLKNETKKVVGGEGSYNFSKDEICNPRNGESNDGKWFILLGKSTNNTLDLYLFKSDSGATPIKEKVGLPYDKARYVQEWNLSGDFPVVKLDNGWIIDFND